MQYRRFGRTQLQMPVLSCGGMRYQFFRRDLPRWLLPSRHQRHVNDIVDHALDSGINHFETARDYGTSEMQLGLALRRHPRERVIVQTKILPGPDPAEFEKKLGQSLGNLGLDYVDMLALHGVNTPLLAEWSMRPGGCWEVVRRFQEQGRVRFIGFSTHATTDVIVRLIQSNRFDFVNLHWYYINRTNWRAIEAANEQDMGVFIISPSDKGGRLYRPPAKLRELCSPLSPVAFNDLFCLSHPQVHTLSVGAARHGDFAEHLEAIRLLDKADTLLPPILELLDRAAVDALGEEWMRTWRVGLPGHEETPGQINIPVILWLRNLLLAFDMEEYAKMRYNLLGNGGHWFPGSSAALASEYDLSACLAASPHAGAIPAMLADAHRRMVGRPRKRLSQAWPWSKS